MDALQEPVELKVPSETPQTLGAENSNHNPGLRALLSIKNFGTTLQKDYERLLQIEKDLEELNKTGLLIIETHTQPEAGESWKHTASAITKAVTGIKDILNTAKENIEKKVTNGFAAPWQQLGLLVKQLNEATKNSINTGYKLLPETQFVKWQDEYEDVIKPLVQSLVDHVDSCRILLQMIERYSPDELNIITKIIVDQIPPDFTYEEAIVYQKEYYEALVNFKKEFKEEKNLWDRFLDILAGGTHQSPSERVMFERWIEGEKGDL
ncbi:MAG: hypothetical protein WAT20_00735 [Ferruginibacter sp.]|nr:hypothetical protein [Chitinophagaceae bacterium]